MFKKSSLLATFVVALVCGSAPRAQGGVIWMGVWGVQRWHHHYAAQGRWTGGWDYASFGFGHHGWGSHPWHWGAAMAYSARPWPPAVDHFLPTYSQSEWRHAYYGDPRRGHGRLFGRHGFHAGHGYDHGGYAADCGPLGGEHGPLSDGVYDDVNGSLDVGGLPGLGPDGVPGVGPGLLPGGVGPALKEQPKDGLKKDELPQPLEKTSAQPATTKLVLTVPADAKVTLAGVDTKSSGTVREFVTSLLAGSPWTNYAIRVEVQRDGQTLVDERTVTLCPGDHQEMTIDFAAPQVASK
jgi:uncharacterized protein (TIGR03000 family)